MRITHLPIDGPVLIRPKILADARGYFMETFKDGWFRDTIADVAFVQDNQALSVQAGTIRGLHYQADPMPQGKLIRCVSGAIFDVAVDIRPGSVTFGQWVGANLTADGAEQMWVPEGFLHGYCALTDGAVVFYKVTAPYSASHDRGIAFDDPDIAIDWPVSPGEAIVSEKDRAQPSLASLVRS
ncbi:dTDP-4-dehydrorhamnose 3,5-epimerase [Asticcacaulis sp. 201]|uniref:dTDP-4-dehydrorhamnose 3,5-epimerase n=1 Tax=Asticcacaulis sp. 201 TaxID=3028787 RepID=UPI002916F822|nr:dTDP-4-dehydrorhamnose 3,5-epimerase [Asticcacaulis sp. 201]MDV6331047.1 dTDP-4-dehydrorhamnose 3,5-epimerase [Asticcacaulis sp. 201]